MSGIVFNIQKFSIHDGPGIRTTVFLKGCPLRCAWCHNPESNRTCRELQLFPHLCTGCGACVPVCPGQCIRMEEGKSMTDRRRCMVCGACVPACRQSAREMAGREMTAEEVIREAGKDWRFYRTSGGGITFSGGEPLMQAEFVLEMIAEAKKKGLSLAIETSGYAVWEKARPVLEQLDVILYDMKELNSDRHKTLTGVGNKTILENLSRISGELSVPFWVRMPLIGGVNDSQEEMEKRADWLASLPRQAGKIYLLPFHDLGISKLLSLDRSAETMASFRPPEPEHLLRLQEILAARLGCEVLIG